MENIESFRDGIAGSNLAIDHLFFSNFRYDPVVLLFFITLANFYHGISIFKGSVTSHNLVIILLKTWPQT